MNAKDSLKNTFSGKDDNDITQSSSSAATINTAAENTIGNGKPARKSNKTSLEEERL